MNYFVHRVPRLNLMKPYSLTIYINHLMFFSMPQGYPGYPRHLVCSLHVVFPRRPPCSSASSSTQRRPRRCRATRPARAARPRARPRTCDRWGVTWALRDGAGDNIYIYNIWIILIKWMILNIYIEYLFLNMSNIHLHIVYIIFIKSCLSIIPSLNYIKHTRNSIVCVIIPCLRLTMVSGCFCCLPVELKIRGKRYPLVN